MEVFEPCGNAHTGGSHTQVARYLRFALIDGELFWEYYDTENEVWMVVERVPISQSQLAFKLIDKYSPSM